MNNLKNRKFLLALTAAFSVLALGSMPLTIILIMRALAGWALA